MNILTMNVIRFVDLTYSNENNIFFLTIKLLNSFQRIELDDAVDYYYGKERNPCVNPSKADWFAWMMGKDSRSMCREFLALVNLHSFFQ